MTWLIGFAVVALAAVAWFAIAQEADEDLLDRIRAELIPLEGTETAYGIPLSLRSLPQFVEWWYAIVPLIKNDPRYVDALTPLVAPCCDDNPAVKCCCETEEGQACNLIRGGKGLAAHLILDLGFDAEQVRVSVLEWFRFARPDYYLATELEARGISPLPYGLTTEGSCYRGLCNTATSEGGCGGMVELIEPAIESVGG
jgi:hypothetical protein